MAISAVPLALPLAFFPLLLDPEVLRVGSDAGVGVEFLGSACPLEPELSRFACGGGDISTISESLLSSTTSCAIAFRFPTAAVLKKSRFGFPDCSLRFSLMTAGDAVLRTLLADAMVSDFLMLLPLIDEVVLGGFFAEELAGPLALKNPSMPFCPDSSASKPANPNEMLITPTLRSPVPGSNVRQSFSAGARIVAALNARANGKVTCFDLGALPPRFCKLYDLVACVLAE